MLSFIVNLGDEQMEESDVNKGYYFVRAMSQSQDDFNVFFNNNVVAVGWSDVNFSQFENVESLVNKVNKEYYANGKTVPSVIGRKKNEVRRFKGLKKGDKIVIPFSHAICLAEVTGEELYSQQDYEQDLSNQRKVSYHRSQSGDVVFIPRDKLSEGLQTRLKLQGTSIADLCEFSEEITNLFIGEDFDSIYNKKRINAIEEFKEKLLNNIQFGKTNLESGGYGLEKLVQELLIIDGYEAKITSKKHII